MTLFGKMSTQLPTITRYSTENETWTRYEQELDISMEVADTYNHDYAMLECTSMFVHNYVSTKKQAL